jgi:DNA topoisomerase-3
MERAGKNLSDHELRRAMRNSGLGTPATRASVIENLVRRKYIYREKKNLKVTERGCNLIQAIPIEELKSAEMTGSWEAKLSSMAEGKGSREEFMTAITQNLTEIIRKIQAAPPPIPEIIQSDSPSLGDCPLCNTPVRKRRKVYTCDSGQKCSMVIFESVAGRKLSTRMVQNLIKKGETPKVKGFKSKRTKKTFEAILKLNEEGRVVFDFNNNSPSSTPSQKKTKESTPNNSTISQERTTPVGMLCPSCQLGSLIQGRAAWGCNRFREGCTFVFPFVQASTPLEAIQKIQNPTKDS